MNNSGPEGWSSNSGYFKLSDEISSDGDISDEDSETETESESSGYNSSKDEKPRMMKGYMKNTKKYKKILFEDDFLPE